MKGKYIKGKTLVRSAVVSISLLVCLLFSAQFALAQNEADWKHELTLELNSKQKTDYLFLVGYLGQFLYTEMKFAYDEDHWVGIVSYPDEGIQYQLDGGYVNNELILLEYNDDEEQVGYWKISRDRESYVCSWENMAGSMDFLVFMHDASWNPDFKKDYGQEYIEFLPDTEENPFSLGLTRHLDGNVEMSVFDKREKRYYPSKLTCINNSCNEMDLSFSMEGKNKTFRVDLSYDEMEMREMSERADLPIYRFNRANSYQTALQTKLNKDYYLVVEYPVLPDDESKKRVDQFVKEIFRKLEVQLETLTEEEENDKRLSMFATVWFDPYYWSDHLISAKWIIQKSWNNEVETMVFNYHIDDHHDLDIDRQFKSDFDHRFYLSHFADSQKKELPEYRDPLLRNKLHKASFDFINFDRAGLILSTDFDTIFGQFQLSVPYEEIAAYLKKKSDFRIITEEQEK